MLGLSVNATKTEATWLEVGARERPPLTEKEVLVGGVHVAIGPHMKYLGVELEQRGIYHHHFRLLAPKLDSTEAALSRLLPNLHGPGLHLDGPRRLYADVLGSMALYGAPEWVVRTVIVSDSAWTRCRGGQTSDASEDTGRSRRLWRGCWRADFLWT